MPRHENTVAFQFPRRRKKKELPPEEWVYPPDVPLPHPEIVMAKRPTLVDGEWVWPPSNNTDTEVLPNQWANWKEDEK